MKNEKRNKMRDLISEAAEWANGKFRIINE